MVAVWEVLGLHVVKKVVEDIYSRVKRWLGIEEESDEEKLVEVLETENQILRQEKRELRDEKESLHEKLDEKETRLTEKREELESQVETVSQSDRILDVLERQGISRKMLVERYDEGIRVILMSFGHQNDPQGKTDKFIKRKLKEEYDAEHTAMGMYVVPPNSVPEEVRDADDLEAWIHGEIYGEYEDYSSIVTFGAVLGLDDIYTRTDYAETKGSWKTVYQAIDFGEELGNKGFVDFIQSSPISPIEPIQDGDLAFFASRVVTGDELETIHRKQKEIERQLGNPNLRELADKKMRKEISETLGDYISKPEEVADAMVEEANLLHEEFNKS